MTDPEAPVTAARWRRYEESLVTTIARTVAIAVVIGSVLALSLGWGRWPVATLLALWPSFGGHWVEIVFLNYLRPRLPVARAVQAMVRLGVWFVGGLGLGFIGIELFVHLVLLLRGRPSLYNGQG
jgi:hypothetical protein